LSRLLQTLTRNGFYSLLSSVIRLGANAVLFVMVARFYGPVQFGQFTTAHTLAVVFTLFADFGFDLLLTTEIGRDRQSVSYITPRMLGLKIVLTLVASLLMCAYPLVQTFSRETQVLIYIFSMYLFFSALQNFAFAFFRGHDELHHESQITLIINVALLVTLLIIALTGGSVYQVAFAFVASRIVGVALAVAKSSHLITSVRPVFDPAWMRSAWKTIVIFGLFFVFGNLYFLIDTVLLSMWRGDHDVGIYQSVFRIIGVTLILSDITVNATLPGLSRLFVVDRAKWALVGSVTSRILFHVGLAVGFFLFAGAELIISLLYGLDRYAAAVPVMRIFGLTVAVRYSVEMSGLMLTTSNRQHLRTWLVIGATITNVAMNMYTIPRFGVIGAASVSFVTNAILGCAFILFSRNAFLEKWTSLERLLPFALLGLASAVGIYSHLAWSWLGVAVILVCYFSLVFVVGYSRYERRIIFEALRAWRP